MLLLLILLAILSAPCATGSYCIAGNETGWYYRKDHVTTAQTFGCTTPSCPGIPVRVLHNGDWSAGTEVLLSHKDCRTKEDLGAVLCPRQGLEASCSLYTTWGTRATSCSDLKAHDVVIMVPQRRLFILPVRERFTEIHHIILPTSPAPSAVPPPQPLIRMRTISAAPRVVELQQVITQSEVQMLQALFRDEMQFRQQLASQQPHTPARKDRRFGMRDRTRDRERERERALSSFGIAADAVEVQGELAATLKKRLFDLLGVFPFEEALAEPLQVLRYNVSATELLHSEYLAADSQNERRDPLHDYSSSNRFSTVLLVLQHAEKGGDVLLGHIDPLSRYTIVEASAGSAAIAAAAATAAATAAQRIEPVEPAEEAKEVDEEERDSYVDSLIQQHSLAPVYTRPAPTPSSPLSAPNPPAAYRQLLKDCYRPSAANASRLVGSAVQGALVLYHQLSDGSADPQAMHAICPVLKGELWLLKLQLWNAPRPFHSPVPDSPQAVSATFEARDVFAAKLYWEELLWEELVAGRPIKVNTFAGHRWHVRLELDEPPVLTWTIQPGAPSQRFVLTARDLPIFNY